MFNCHRPLFSLPAHKGNTRADDSVNLLNYNPKGCYLRQVRVTHTPKACRERDEVSFRGARTFPVAVDGALVMGVAAGLLGGFVYGDGAAVRVGVEQEQRLEVIFDAFADHVFPPGANLQETDDGQRGGGGGWQPDSSAVPVSACERHKGG